MGVVLSAARRSAVRVVSAGAAGDIIGLSSQRSPRRFRRLGPSPGAGPRWALFSAAGRVAVERRPVAKAEADLAEAERADPKSGGVSALRSVIALVGDQKDDALRLAETGAGLDPNSPLPQAALSYAHQGRFEIEKALEHAKRAVELAPKDALLWARVSELELSRGDLDAALEAAQKAETLSPALARTQTVLGFAYLTRIEVDKAKTAFERAIQGDPADPLPRLGMGLAKIRDGDLDEGTREIETAASLDPNNSLVRSYLGKAYYEQKRDGLASSEYEQAKLLDPKDPTPWFYDAIHKQTTNRPVEALRDLQTAIDLNDNRAVYRSKLLLDDDLAARSASLGRVYRDLGFDRIALVEGWRSIIRDPGNYSAHRLLADSYSILPRHEVARVSELLQSQLWQPLNITPVQPRLAESEPLILESSGLAEPSFNEFNPLFTRNRVAVQASAIGSNNSTYGDEVTLSGVWNQFSYSLGQLHYLTDGFRDNNDLVQDSYNAFAQARISPKINLQAEYRHREAEHGDLRLFFVPGDFDRAFRRTLRTDVLRFGAHFALAPHSDVIASVIHLDEVDNIDNVQDTANRGYLGELQYLLRTRWIDLISGGSHYSGDQEDSRPVFGQADVRHTNGYFYSYWRYPETVTWTLGMSVDALDDPSIRKRDLHKVNPKLGILWDVTPSTTLRFAAFNVLKRSLPNDQTIEPTQLAGFNQFFDDLNGTFSTRYGVGLDHKFSPDLYGGLEASRRELKVPIGREQDDAVLPDDWEEQAYRAYLHWAPRPYLALAAQYELEEFSRDIEGPLSNVFPRTVTHTAPISLRVFDPRGFFADVTATYVHQQVNFDSEAFSGEDDFAIIDLGTGYRLPKRYGIVRLETNNLFDEEFDYEGVNFRTNRDVSPRFSRKADGRDFVQSSCRCRAMS